jgi:prevent-host-death family protein
MAHRSREINAAPAETRIAGSEVSRSFGEIIDRAADGERIVITRYDRDRVVMLSKRDYDALLERAGLTPPVAAAV